MATPKKMVAVYDKDGNKLIVDNLNALDMVASCGYTYQPGRVFSPVDTPPHALQAQDLLKRDPKGARIAQSVLDGTGSNVLSAAEPEPEDDDDGDDIVFDAGATATAPEPVFVAPPTATPAPEAVEEAPEPKAEVAPASTARGRPRKA